MLHCSNVFQQGGMLNCSNVFQQGGMLNCSNVLLQGGMLNSSNVFQQGGMLNCNNVFQQGGMSNCSNVQHITIKTMWKLLYYSSRCRKQVDKQFNVSLSARICFSFKRHRRKWVQFFCSNIFRIKAAYTLGDAPLLGTLFFSCSAASTIFISPKYILRHYQNKCIERMVLVTTSKNNIFCETAENAVQQRMNKFSNRLCLF